MIRTDNDFLLAGTSERVGPMLPMHITTREKGLRTAAWLVAMCEILPQEDPDERPTFEEIRTAIGNT